MGLFSKLFPNANDREITKLNKKADEIEALAIPPINCTWKCLKPSTLSLASLTVAKASVKISSKLSPSASFLNVASALLNSTTLSRMTYGIVF